jgi:hypothetical protein
MAVKISKLVSDNNVSKLYPEPCLLENVNFRNEMLKKGMDFSTSGYDIVASLAENMLNHIAENKRKPVEKLEIVIIAGNDAEALKNLVLKLAGSVGLVTIAGDMERGNYSGIETWLESICDETGLCVRITANIENAVKDCDVAISFEENLEYGKYVHIPVIWFGKKDSYAAKRYEFYPYRIEIDFPAILYNHHTQELVSCFGSLGVAEVFLGSEINADDGNKFPGIERMDLLKRKLYEKMEDIRYIRKLLE